MLIKRKLPVMLLAIATVLVSGCGPGVEDYSCSVGGNYQVFRANSRDISIAYIEPGMPGGSTIIPPKVVKIAWNDQYVIAEQQELRPTTPDPYGPTEPINVFHYWILDKKAHTPYGPYDIQTFEQKKKEFHIPDSMELKDVGTCEPKDYGEG